jgi:Tfp pilus assembly protein PilN
MKLQFPKLSNSRHPKPVVCDICLIVYNDRLLSAKHTNLVAQAKESLFDSSPAEIARIARQLLPAATRRQQRIALALPSHEFVATSLKLPASIDAQHLKNAVKLQLPSLLPGMNELLLLAVQVQKQGDETYALWLPQKRAEELFQAFNKVDKEGLFLTCILPRPLVALPRTKGACQVYDEDEITITYLEWSGGVIQRWLHLPKVDCEHIEFKKQLEQAMSHFTKGLDQEWKTTFTDWEELPMPAPVIYNYAFIPPSAALRMTQQAKRKRRRRLAALAVLLMMGLLAGVYLLIDYEKRLEEQLLVLQRRTGDISQLRAEVAQIENLIGPVKKFPHQNVLDILERLNDLIPKNSWIINFQIEGGVVTIEGDSPAPNQLIEILSQQPDFDEVRQSKETRGQTGKSELKFGISFKLQGFDLKSYWLEYFPQR